MDTVILILFVCLAAGYITSVHCRFARSRDRQPAWYFALLGAIGAAILTIIIFYRGALFHPSKWNDGKVQLWILVSSCFAIVSAIGLVPALLVVYHYREKYSDDHPWTEQEEVS